jgi:hypothetical protein
MENNDYRPHLLIPEEEVEQVENNARGGPEERKVDRFEHGEKLSSDLKGIVEAYTKIQGSDSLSDSDIRVFEIMLPEGEKMNVLKQFLAEQGLKINAVTNERRATVTASQSTFEDLHKRINDYRDGSGAKYKYPALDGFHFREPEEKQSTSLRAVIERTIGSERIDIQLTLIPHLDESIWAKATAFLTKKIAECEGELVTAPYTLTDGTPIIRAEVPIKNINALSRDTAVCRVTRTAFFPTAMMYTMKNDQKLTLDPSVNIDELPIVAVLDNGVEFSDELSPIIVKHWLPSGDTGGNCSHGTGVASKVAFADLYGQLANGALTPRARIIDCNIRGKDPLCKKDEYVSDTTMIRRIGEAVRTFCGVTKVFNLSSAAEEPIEGDVISNLGYELDTLSLTYGVKFVIAAGNHRLFETQDTLQDIIGDDDARIALPADSMLNISVGAIVGKDYKDSLSQSYDIAPYSRIGPGFSGLRKPDVVTFAGTKYKTGFTPPDEYSLMLGTNGDFSCEAGTSFTAPVVAGDLANIALTVPDGNILLAEALLYHGSSMPVVKDKKIKRDDAAYYGNLYGRGIPDIMSSMFSSAHRAIFLHSGTLTKKYKQHVKFLVPSILKEMDMSKRKPKINVRVTCVTQSPIDKSKGLEYLGAYVHSTLHQINSNGTAAGVTVSDADCRKKWDTCFHFEKSFSSFSCGDWEIWLRLFTRWEVEDTYEVEYALAITIEDLTQTYDIYNEIVAEAQGRFQPVQLTRLPIRQ